MAILSFATNASRMMGLAPQLRDTMTLYEKALSGSLALVCSPATVTSDTSGTASTRNVVVSLKTSDGDVCVWANDCTFTATLTTSQTAGTANGVSIASTSNTLTRGQKTITVTLATPEDGRGQVAADYNQLEVTADVLGYSLACATSKQTFA